MAISRNAAAIAAALGAVLAAGLSGAAAADPVADFYRGKTISVVVPIGPGGTYDMYGRLAATIMEKYLPGNPRAVTQLMTGAGGALATNYMANRRAEGRHRARQPARQRAAEPAARNAPASATTSTSS